MTVAAEKVSEAKERRRKQGGLRGWFGRQPWYVRLAFALVGAVLEMTVIRRLAVRPLDTLLATWGASLILQRGHARSLSPWRY